MEAQIVKYAYEEQVVEFDVSSSKLMVNATEMGKIFGTDTEAFTRNEGTKRFIEACLKTENSRFLRVQTLSDLITSKQRSGTWMHRVLALKFAAWLDPNFEVWVYHTIDQIIQSRGPINSDRVETRKQVNARIQKNQAKVRKAQLTIEEVAGQALEIMEKAKLEIAKDNRILAKLNREDADQLNMFVNTQEVEETEAAEV